jgi:hypothetical protein
MTRKWWAQRWALLSASGRAAEPGFRRSFRRYVDHSLVGNEGATRSRIAPATARCVARAGSRAACEWIYSKTSRTVHHSV